MSKIYFLRKNVFTFLTCMLLASAGLFAQETFCLDGLDNDSDGLTDCFDPDCADCDFDCEYRIPAAGIGDITLNVGGAGTDTNYTEVFVLIDSVGEILHMTTDVPATFTNVTAGQYLALALSYATDAGINNLTVGSDINVVSSTCYEMSESYAFQVCANEKAEIINLETDPLCFCAGETPLTQTASILSPDNDSLTATISFSSGYILGEDQLLYTGTLPVSNFYNPVSGEMILGPAPPNVIEYAILNTVYKNTMGFGNETSGPRVVSFVLSDGIDDSPVVDRTFAIGSQFACACAEIGVAKTITNITDAASGTLGNQDVTYQIVFENSGGLDLGKISLVENLAAQFNGAFVAVAQSPTFAASTASSNPSLNFSYNGNSNDDIFDGNTGKLKPGEQITIELTVEIDNSEIAVVPLENQATVKATAIDGNEMDITDGTGNPLTVSDVTDSGTDPLTDNGEGGTDDPTVLLIPEIGATKALVSQAPHPTLENIYELNFEILVENTGSTVLENITLTDDMSAWGAALVNSPSPTVSVLNISATTAPTANSANFNGSSDFDLLVATGSGVLNPGESFKVEMTVFADITQVNSGLENSATAAAIPTDGTGGGIAGFPTVEDITDDATDLPEGNPNGTNPNTPGDTGGEDDKTPISFPANPRFAKAITAAPQLLANRNYSLTYEFEVENIGSAAFCQMDLNDDLNAELGCGFVQVLNVNAINLTNTSGTSTAPSLNTIFDGFINKNLFNSDGCLMPGDALTVSIEVEIDPSCPTVSEPLANSATLEGEDANSGVRLTVDSDDHTDLNNDTNYDNESGGLKDPTVISIPRLDAAKEQIASTELPNGNVLVTFNYILTNSGNATISGVALEDDIQGQHGTAFVSATVGSITGNVSNLGGANPSFTGAGTNASATVDGDDILDRTAVLAPGETMTVTVDEEINISNVPPTGLTNQALLSGTDPNGDDVSDLSDSGTDPTNDTDNPTPLDFGPRPEITKALATAPINVSGSIYELTFDFELKNNGTEAMCFIEATEDLATQLGCSFQSATGATNLNLTNTSGSSISPTVSPIFNGDSQTNLFASNGCLFPGDELTWTLTVMVDADCTTLPAPMTNSVTVTAQDSNGDPVSDTSDDQTDLDNDNTPDFETGGTDDPTQIYLPKIALTKALVGSSPLPNGNVELDLRFNVQNTGNANLSNLSLTDDLTNFGASLVGISSITVQNINASNPPAANTADYTGTGTDTDLLVGSAVDLLAPGQTFTILMSIEVSPQVFGIQAQPIENQAIVNGSPVDDASNTLAGYTPVSDLSDDGTNLTDGGNPTSDNAGAANDNGFGGTDDPTIMSLPSTPRLSKALSATPIKMANGNYEVTYQFLIENLGGSQFCNINLEDDLASQIGCAFVGVSNIENPILKNISGNSVAPTKNNSFNGTSNINLLSGNGCLVPGDSLLMNMTIELNASCLTDANPIENLAAMTAEDVSGNQVADTSDDNTDLDNDNTPDNETGGDTDPTNLYLPNIALTKAITNVTQLSNGFYELDFRFNVENTGNAILSNLKLEDLLAFSTATVGAGPVVSVSNINATVAPAANNGTYNGASNIDLLAGANTDRLEPGQRFVVNMTVQIDPNTFLLLVQPVENQAIATGSPIESDGSALSGYADGTDTSDDGTTLPDGGDPTTDNAGASNDNGFGGTNDPTVVSLPRINIVKEVANVQPSLNYGNFYVTFDMVVKNSGTTPLENIQVIDDLQTMMGASFLGVTAGPIITSNSGSPTLPNAGTFPIQIFDGTSGMMNPQDEIKISFIAEIDPNAGGTPAALMNSAKASATNPNGPDVTDISDDGTNPDTDNGDGDYSTPTAINLPQISIAKSLVNVEAAASGDAGHFDATYRFYIKNIGNAPLTNLSLIEKLEDQMGAAFVNVIGSASIYAPLTSATSAPLINTGFTGRTTNTDIFLGTATDELASNEILAIDLTVEINPSAAGAILPIENQATAAGEDTNGTNVSDDSDSGINPDTNNGSGGTNDPTPFDCLPANINAMTSTPEICEGEDALVTLTGDFGGATFEWIDMANPSTILSTDQNPSLLNLATTTTYQVTVFPNDGQCFTGLSDQVTIIVTPKPTTPIAQNIEICEGATLQLTTDVADGYAWSGPNGFTSSDQNPFVSTNTSIVDAGNYTISIQQGDCWSTPGTVEVIVNPESTDQPSIASNSPICEGEDLVLQTSSDFDAYQWIGPGGRSTVTLANPLLNTTSGSTTIPVGDAAYLSGEWTVYGIDADGCISSEATPITIVINEALDAPMPTSTAPVCLGAEFELIAGGNYPANAQFAWYDTNPNVGSPSPFSTQENPIVNNISAVGLYTYYLTVSLDDCISEPGSVAVAVNASPNITADNNAVDCMNPSIEIRLTSTPSGGQFPYEYAWTGPNGFISTLQNPTLPGNSESLSGNYIVEVTDENGCTATAETELEVSPKTEQPAIVASNENICMDETLVIETTTVYTGTIVSYNWSGPNGTSTVNGDYPNAPQITINGVDQTTAGDYSLIVEVDGCSSFASEEIEINIHEAPQVVASNDATNCMNPTQVINLSVNVTGGSPSFSYAWTGPNGFNSILQNPTLPNPNVSLSGSYIVEVTDGYGCSASSETVIDLMNDTDQAVVTNNGPLCEGEELIIETTTDFTGANVDYFWTGPNGSTLAGDYPNAPQLIFSPVEESAEGDYTLIVSVNGCSSVASEPTTAVINKGPEVLLTYDYTLEVDCSPSDLSLFADITVGDSPIKDIQWMGPAGFFSTQEDPIITSVTPAHNGSYELIITDETGCQFISTIEVGGISNTQAQPIITGTPQTCGGGQVILTVPTYSGSSVSYNWNVPGVTSNITGWNSNQLIISPVTIDNAGSFSVDVTVDGCVLESPDYLVQIFSTPEVTATNNATDCMDPTQDINLTANTLGGIAPIKYQWTGPNGFVAITESPTLPNANASLSGTYIVTATDANGCSATAETVVNVSGQPNEPTLTTNASVLCEGSDYVVQGATYAGANVYYEWTGPKGSTTSGAYDDSPTLNVEDVTVADEGDYTLQVTVDGCQTATSASVSLEIVPLSASPEVKDTTVCEGAILQLVTTTNADSYEWTGPNGFTSSSRNPFVTNAAAVISGGVYELIVKYGNCESTPAQLTVTILPAPAQPSIASNAPICDSSELIFTATPGFETYLWVNQFVNSANPLLTTTQNTTTIPFGDSAYLAGNWAVIGINADGCESIISDEIEIIINEIGDEPIITTDAPVCAGEAFTLYPGSNYPTGTEFNWYDADPTLGGTPFSTQREPVISNTNIAGDYDYWLIVSINDCASNTGTITVTVNDLPTVTADNDGTECSDPTTDINLTATPSGGNAPYTFAWSGPNGFVSINQNPVIAFNSQDISGNYIVEMTDAAGCTAIAQTTISASEKVDEPEITYNSPICAGERLILNATTYTGTSVRYEWTGPLGTTTSGAYPDAPQIIIDPATTDNAGDYTIQVTVDGCASNPSELVAIDVEAAPEVELSYNYSVNTDCSLNDLTLNTTILIGNVADLNFAWTGPNGFASSDQNPIIQNVTTDYNGSYTLTVTNGGDCSIIETLEINDIRDAVNKPLIVSSGNTCSGGEITLIGTAYTGSNVEYIWTVPGNGANITGLTTNEISISPSSDTDSGEYILTVIVDNCTVVSDPFDVQIFDAPEVDIAYSHSPNENCRASDLFFTSTVTFGSNTTITYAWSGPNGFTSADPNPEILNADETFNGFYTLVVTDENGCSADATIQVSNLKPFLTQPVITGTSQSCEGGEIILTIPTYSGAFVRYFWTTPGPTDNITGLTSNQIIINPLTLDYAGNYEVTVVVDGCVATSLPYEVKIFETPTVTASNDGAQCIPPTKDIALTANAANGVAPYTFEWSGPNNFQAVDSVTIVPNVGTNMSGIYVVTVTDANGCTATAETIIDATVQPDVPQLAATATELCEGENYTITAPIYNGFNVTYNWSGPLGTTANGDYPNSNILTISNVSKVDSGSYTVMVTVDGCSSTVSAEVVLNVVEKLPPSDVSDVNVCENGLLQLTTSTVADKYFWTGPNNFESNQQEPIVATDAQIINSGVYELYVQIGDCLSEVAQLTVTVSEFAEQPTIQANSPICEGEDIYLTTSVQCAEYLWIGPDGDSPITMSNPLLKTDTNFTSIPMGDVAYDAGMWYLICITNGGCESEPSEEVEVVINAVPETPTPTAPSTACENAPFQLFAGDNYPIDAIYKWYSMNPTSSGAIAFSTEKNPIVDDNYTAGFYTFFLTVTVDGCTSEPGSVIMTIDEAPSASPTNNGINCSGLTVDLILTANPSGGIAPYTFDWEFPNGNTSRAENPVIPFASGDVSGTYTLVVTDSKGCSSLPIATVVRVGDMPLTPSIQSSVSQLCEGERLTMVVSPYTGDSVTYHWTIPNGDVISTTNASLIIDSIYMAAHHGAYSLQVEVDGCKSAASGLVFVNVFDMPNMPNVPDDMMVCEGTDVSFKTTTQGSGFNYVWSGPNNYISRGQFPAGQNADAILNFSQLNVGEYKLEIETQNCKSDAGSFRIDMENRPATPVLETELGICDGDTLRLETGGMINGYTYQWIAPGATTGSDFGDPTNPKNPVWTIDSTTIITGTDNPNLYESGEWMVRIVSPNGCNSETSIAVNVDITPMPVAPPVLANGPLCEGDDVELTTTDIPGLNYQWYSGNPQNGGTLISNSTNPVLPNQPGGINEYFLMVDMNGCSSDTALMRSVQVEINALPSVDSVSNTGPYCAGDTIELFSPTIGSANYTWSGPMGFNSTQEDPRIFSATAQNSGTYTLTVQNQNCKSEPISMQVYVTPQPVTPVAENDGPGCIGTRLQLSSPSVPTGGFVLYEWTGPNGFVSNLQNPVIDSLTMADAGEYQLTVSVNGCQSLVSAPTMVDVNTIPAAPVATNNTSIAAPICDGETVQLQTQFIPGASYQWVGPNGFTSDLFNPIIEDADDRFAGDYQVMVTIGGCSSVADTTSVFINQAIEVPVAISNGAVCEGDVLTMSVSNPDAAMNYVWYSSPGSVQVGVGPNLTFAPADVDNEGDYYVVANANGCFSDPQDLSASGEDAFVFGQVDVPSRDVAFIGDDLFVCDDTVTLNAKQLFTGTGLWTSGDPDNDITILRPDDNSTLIAHLQSGDNPIVWSVYSGACGITSSDTAIVTLINFPEAVGDLYQIGYGEVLDSTVITNDVPNTSDFVIELITEPRQGFVQLNMDGTFKYVPNAGFIGADFFEYQLCNPHCLDHCVTARAVIEVGVDEDCMVPDVFTPNGDGMNETFLIPCLQQYDGSRITIFNRWGDEVFASSNYQNDWDGTYKGEKLPVGTYFYILNMNDPDQTVRNGYIFLQR